MKWVDVKTPPGKPVVAARVEPIPPGPYLVVGQHSLGMFKNEPWEIAVDLCSKVGTEVTYEIPSSYWGRAILAKLDGRAIIVAYEFDTGD
jgi:hypothetical protein